MLILPKFSVVAPQWTFKWEGGRRKGKRSSELLISLIHTNDFVHMFNARLSDLLYTKQKLPNSLDLKPLSLECGVNISYSCSFNLCRGLPREPLFCRQLVVLYIWLTCWLLCRDVSGVEVLMDQHQSRKVEIDGREESFNGVIKMGEELLAKNHYASDEVSTQFSL